MNLLPDLLFGEGRVCEEALQCHSKLIDYDYIFEISYLRRRVGLPQLPLILPQVSPHLNHQATVDLLQEIYDFVRVLGAIVWWGMEMEGR